MWKSDFNVKLQSFLESRTICFLAVILSERCRNYKYKSYMCVFLLLPGDFNLTFRFLESGRDAFIFIIASLKHTEIFHFLCPAVTSQTRRRPYDEFSPVVTLSAPPASISVLTIVLKDQIGRSRGAESRSWSRVGSQSNCLSPPWVSTCLLRLWRQAAISAAEDVGERPGNDADPAHGHVPGGSVGVLAGEFKPAV